MCKKRRNSVHLLICESIKYISNSLVRMLYVIAILDSRMTDRFSKEDSAFFTKVITVTKDGIDDCLGVCADGYKRYLNNITMYNVHTDLLNASCKDRHSLYIAVLYSLFSS